MIKEFRVAKWVEGKKWGLPNYKWDLQFRREGSTKWEPVPVVKLSRRPKLVSEAHQRG
jgi:hypothetical protein